MTNPLPLQPEDAEQRARKVVAAALESYARKRIHSYEELALGRLFEKDLLMVALRGITAASELLDELFAAFESSSEETHMGETAQEIALGLASDAVDLGDLVVERDAVLWVAEVKSQTNTVNARSRPQILRVLKRRVGEAARIRAVRRREVRAMIGVLRGNPRDSEITYKARNHADSDIDGFTYRYLVGRSFWEWLTGRPSIYSLLGEIESLSSDIAFSRNASRQRLQRELDEWLSTFGSERSAGHVMRLIDGGHRPPRARRPRPKRDDG